MKLSIITTLYYSAPYLEEFYDRISAAAGKITQDYEIILVNDGSPDNSLEVALILYEKDEKVKIIDLSRNFGHHRAIFTGLNYAQGEYVFLIDCDLEEPPELLEKFMLEKTHNPETDVIYGVQEKRKGKFLEKISGELFYNIFNMVSETKIPKNPFTARLMTKKYVESLIEHKEREIAFDGICALTGYNQKAIPIKKGFKGSTSYTFYKKLKLAINYTISFTAKPLEQIFYFGIIITFLAFLYLIKIIIKALFLGINVSGWASIMVSLWIIGGIIILNLGIIGIYLSKIFIETKNRPYSLVKKVYSRNQTQVEMLNNG